MLRSKDLKDYFEARLADIRPDVRLEFDVCLYFSQNEHLMLWRPKGDVPTEAFLEKYRAKSLSKIWIHQSEKGAFDLYMNPPKAAPVPEPVAAPAVPAPRPDPRTREGAFLAALLDSSELSEREKQAAAAETARSLLQSAGSATTPREQKKADALARRTVQDLLDQTAPQIRAFAGDIWHLSEGDSGLDHGVNVATYAVILAMAFGRIDRELIADIALAGLLHDVGISQIPAAEIPDTLMQLEGPRRKTYSEHVPEGVRLLELHAPTIPARVKALISQHHEKFDGSGYPQGLRGFKVDDVAQLVAMADLIDAMANGSWDGQQRTRKEAFDRIETMEKTRTFPEFFNPEVFAAVVSWLHTGKSMESAKQALEVVEQQAKSVVKGS